MIYTIGLLSQESKKSAKKAKRALEDIAKASGGVAYFPENVEDVHNICQQVAHDIRNQYTIGYRPSTPTNAGGYRTIRVDARSRGYNKLTVRTRSGYYAGQEQAAGGGN